MIRKVRGNLLEADVQALVNSVNTVGVMGRGIALQFKRAFPENYKVYRQACQRKELRTGRVLTYDLNKLENPRFIINFPTKEHWKGKSRMEYIEEGLKALVREIDRLGIQSIAIPALGSGLGGLNWNDVYQKIEAAFRGLESVDVLVYEPARAPEPSRMKDRTKRPQMTAGRAALLGLMKRYLEPLMDDAISMLEIHKLMYFMQEAGEDLRLNYTKGVYGPYAANLHHVLERIEGHFTIGYGEGSESPGTTIEYIPAAVEEAERFLKSRSPTHQRFDRIASLIQGFETPYGMELLASVHWVAWHEDEMARESSSIAVQRVHEWNDRKRRMFRAEHIEASWHHLQSKDWL
jgi:O-acetyl-ADP-ribose deacetylase (regulator of RNase III)